MMIFCALILFLITPGGRGQLASCPHLPVPLNGRISYSPTGAHILDGTVATYSCEEGYLLVGGTERACYFGSWTGGEVACQPPPVYVALGSTNYPLNNSQVVINSIGESNDAALLCHTDSFECCRGTDNPYGSNGHGDWILPNGTVIQRSLDIEGTVTNLFYRSRDFRLIRLHRRGSVATPTGSYCCVIPKNTTEIVTFCVELVSCSPPPSIANGSPGIPTSSIAGGTVTYSCEDEFVLVGSAISTCLSTGSWTTPPSCQTPPAIFLSFSSTNYVAQVPVIPLSSVGEGRDSSLICHTDPALSEEGGLGNWYYPNGTAVTGESGWYVNRDNRNVSLNRRAGTGGPSGIYCCFVSASGGSQAACALLVSQTVSSDGVEADVTMVTVIYGVIGLAALLIVCITVAVVIVTCLTLRHKRKTRKDLNTVSFHDQKERAPPLNDANDQYQEIVRPSSGSVGKYSLNMAYKTVGKSAAHSATNPGYTPGTEGFKCEEVYDELRC